MSLTELSQVLARLLNPPNAPQNDYAGDAAVPDTPVHDENVLHLNIDMITGEDELSDIPAEMREVVAAEDTVPQVGNGFADQTIGEPTSGAGVMHPEPDRPDVDRKLSTTIHCL